ncbi:MAG: oxygen-independent coproporphyrinogen III oxidase [Kofleriaceae bacterium]
MTACTSELASRLAAWSTRGPRYTSYPPATAFRAIEPADVHHELAALGRAGAPISLYMHVPFCRQLCWYCGCNVIATRDPARGVQYAEALAMEIAQLAGRVEGAPVHELALGGGSPNFLAPQTLRALIGALERAFAWAPDARRSIELDPRTTTAEQIEVLGELGFTAVSVGVQDFAAPVQDAIHRHQTAAQTGWLIELARRSGFDDVNLDIVYGLPRQIERGFLDTLDRAIELAPDRVALFGYAHLPSKFPHQALVERAGRLPDPGERAALFLAGIERFEAAGYVHIGLDHFARPGSRLARAAAEGRLVRSFQGYAERRAEAILGLGVSAISSTPGMHWQSPPELAPWHAAVAEGRTPIERGVVLDDDDRLRGALIARLMCDGVVDLARLGREHAVDPERTLAGELAALDALDELARHDRTARTIETTPLGRLLVRNVCQVFDRYHGGTHEHRHSATV